MINNFKCSLVFPSGPRKVFVFRAHRKQIELAFLEVVDVTNNRPHFCGRSEIPTISSNQLLIIGDLYMEQFTDAGL